MTEDSTSNIDPGLFDENTTFVNGQLKETNDQTSGIVLTATEFTEIEYALARHQQCHQWGDLLLPPE